MIKGLSQKLASLGVAFIVEPDKDADPERTLLATIKLFSDERKMLAIALGWLTQYGDLIHIARLRALAKDMNAEELAWLGGLASSMLARDRRWTVIVQFVEIRLGTKKKQFFTSALDQKLAKKKGADPHFERFGVCIPRVSPSPEKKLYKRAHTLKHHQWLRLRALFGANWRADILWQLIQDRNQTSYRIAKTLGCNIETAYRNVAALKEAGAMDVIVLQGTNG